MLLRFTFAALALAPPAAAQGPAAQTEPAQAAAWMRYTYPGEEFSAELPGMPSVFHTQRGVNNDWRKTEKVRVFSHYSGGVIFFVVAYDNPHRSESLDFFAAHMRGAWGLTPKAPVTLGGFEGRSYEVASAQRGRLFHDVHGEARAFRTKKHAYLALALARERGRPEVERFLNAFAVVARPEGERIAEDEPVPRYVPPKTQEGARAGSATGEGRGGGLGDMPAGDAEEGLKLMRPERAPGEPHAMREVGRKALIVFKPEPPYTEQARKRGVTGAVRLRVVLSATGRVTDAEVLKPLSEGLTESAIGIARHMRFFPAEKDGRPVSQHVVLEYNFNIY